MSRLVWSRFFSSYGMSVVLVLLCAYYSWATLQRQQATGAPAARELAPRILRRVPTPGSVLIVTGDGSTDQEFAERLTDLLKRGGVNHVDTSRGDPQAVRKALRDLTATGSHTDAVVASQQCSTWLPNLLARAGPPFSGITAEFPQSYRWPTFLMAENLLNVANQIVVVAVIAVGMTMVIITGGIDLSVGSLMAMSSAIVGVLVRDYARGASASDAALVLISVLAIATAALVGAFSGLMFTVFGVPPFIATLAMLEVASGLAYIIATGQSISDLPQSYTWLGRGATVLSMPNAVLLMIVVYLAAHILMSRTRLGRYIYAVGGNPEAARLSGVPVRRVLFFVYTLGGAMAGLGGVIVTSQLKSASPTYGLSYELYVIAAVVVGGTSLAGGSGKIFGTLIGALIMAVINNGMNLTGVESYKQRVVLGFVILGAVLLDRLKHWNWNFLLPRRDSPRLNWDTGGGLPSTGDSPSTSTFVSRVPGSTPPPGKT